MHHFTLAGRDAWIPEELAILRRLWTTASDAELQAALPGRTLNAAKKLANQRFGLTTRQRPQER